MKLRTLIALFIVASAPLLAQIVPKVGAAYISPSAGVWEPWSAAASFGQLSYNPQPSQIIGLYCQATSTSAWAPCVPGSGGGGVSSVVATSPIVASTTSGVVTVSCPSCGTTTPPSFDQITSGTNLGHGLVCGAGCVMSPTGGGFISANELNGTLLSGLTTGLMKNTTATGVPSIATAGTDYLLPTGSATGLSKASSSAFGVSECDNTTITCAGGVFTAVTGGGGSVTSVSVTTANGVSGTVATATTTPAITLVLGAITPSSVTTTGATNGAFTATYTGSAATAPTTNQFQISPAIGITTPWSLSPAAAPASGLLYATNTAGVVQQTFRTVQGTDSSILSSGTISGTLGAALCLDAQAGATTSGCTGGSGPANVHTATTFTGIGAGASATTPTHTLDVNGGTDTSILVKAGSAQASAPLNITDASSNTLFSVDAFGDLIVNGAVGVYDGFSTTGLGLMPVIGDTKSINTSHTAAVGSSGTPIVLATATQFGSNNFQSYVATCYLNNKSASTGTVSLFLTWTDDVGVKTSAAYTMNTVAAGTFLAAGPIPVLLNATSTATTLGYYTTITGTPTYGLTCHAERVD